MYELKKIKRYLRVHLLGPGPRRMKKNLPGRGLTKVEKRWYNRKYASDGGVFVDLRKKS